MKYKVNRDVTQKECHWLKATVQKGTIVYKYMGHTYGCITPAGIAVSRKDQQLPFFELPKDALTII